MKINQKLLTAMLLITCLSLLSCGNGNSSDTNQTNNKASKSNLKEESVSYKVDTTTYKGYLVYDQNITGKRPAVLVVPEWWGLNEYPKKRARQLAEMGYVAMAVDMYGNGKVANTPQEAQAMATPYYQNPQLTKKVLDVAIEKLKDYKQTDSAYMAAIGYCYGGYVVLNAAKLGADLKGVVSFHGSLAGVSPSKDLLKAKILVCHGEADKFESPQEIAAFKKGMDSIGADYTFKTYANATHAFTNPQATETGKKFNMPIEYNAAADSASWSDMKLFFGRIFAGL